MPGQNGSASRSGVALPKILTPEFGLGIFAILLGLYVAFDASTYHDGSTYDSLGPSLMPFVIAVGLIMSGIGIAAPALLSRSGEEPLGPMDWMPVLLLGAAIIVPILFIRSAGWIPVITIVFALSARAFGSRRTLLDLVVGLLFGFATFVVFNYGLGLSLPAGSLLARFFG